MINCLKIKIKNIFRRCKNLTDDVLAQLNLLNLEELNFSRYVWIRLIIGSGNSVEDKVPVYDNNTGDIIVDAFLLAVKRKMASQLSHCNSSQLEVFEEVLANPLKHSAIIPAGITRDNPLIVRAPSKSSHDFFFFFFLI